MIRLAHSAVAASLGVGLGVGIALAAGWLASNGGAGDSPVAASSPAESLASAGLDRLQAELEFEREARRELAREVARLRAQIEQEPADLETEQFAETENDASEPQTAAWFDADALRELGLIEPDVARLREHFESLELAELYLRDRASRDGWANRPRYFRELRELREALRVAVGDDDYDRMLYAGGRNNRVIVANVLEQSPAAEAGLARGDEIIAYAGQRIFDGQALTQATTGGKAGAWTEIRAQRDGRSMRMFVPRGPLGVRLSPKRRPPDTHR